MQTLMQAHRQWMERPVDERFISLPEMLAKTLRAKTHSAESIVPARRMILEPTPDNRGLSIVATLPDQPATQYTPTHWAFGQLCELASAPSRYLRTLPSPMACDLINYGLQFEREAAKDVGFLFSSDGADKALRAACGGTYGRIWNADIVNDLINRFGDGVEGHWRVPGIMGRRINVNRDNTTLFAGDQDMFVFLADEDRRIEVPNRRAGLKGSMARGFFAWNSEVGARSFGIAAFLFDYVCGNRIVWGVEQFREIRLRHTASNREAWDDEIVPALAKYAAASATPLLEHIENARKDRFDGDVEDFLARRFGKRMVPELMALHEKEEGRPIETRWDVVTAATAMAREIPYQNDRVKLERLAGALLD